MYKVACLLLFVIFGCSTAYCTIIINESYYSSLGRPNKGKSVAGFVPYYTGRIKVTREEYGEKIISNGNIIIYAFDESTYKPYEKTINKMLSELTGTLENENEYYANFYDFRAKIEELLVSNKHQYKYLTSDDGKFSIANNTPERYKLIMVVGAYDYIYIHQPYLETMNLKKNYDVGEIEWDLDSWDFSHWSNKNPPYGERKNKF